MIVCDSTQQILRLEMRTRQNERSIADQAVEITPDMTTPVDRFFLIFIVKAGQ